MIDTYSLYLTCINIKEKIYECMSIEERCTGPGHCDRIAMLTWANLMFTCPSSLPLLCFIWFFRQLKNQIHTKHGSRLS